MTIPTITVINPPVTSAEEPIIASLVAEDERLAFLPKFFKSKIMLKAESLTYGWMREFCSLYKGGYWNFYTLSNGGFYMAPVMDSALIMLRCDMNGFKGRLSSHAAGIIVTLYMLNYLVCDEENEYLIPAYYQLREFASQHAEKKLIYQAID